MSIEPAQDTLYYVIFKSAGYNVATMNKKFFSKAAHLNHEKGFSLVSVTIAVAILGLAFYGVFSGLNFASRAQRHASMKETFKAVEPALRSAISRAGRDFVFVKNCGDSSLQIADRLAVSFSSLPLLNESSGKAAIASLAMSVTAAHPGFSDAASRCSTPKMQYFSVGSGGGDFLYMCLTFAANQTLKSSMFFNSKSFWSLDNTFMELVIMPVDLRRDEPSTCLDADKPGRGLKLMYTVYYADRIGSTASGSVDISPNKAAGIFYVARD